jgi:hypothetical protein
MDRIFKLLFVSLWVLFAGSAAAQTPVPRITPLEIKKPLPAGMIAPIATPSRAVPAGVTLAVDEEALVQAEIKRQVKKRDDISSALAKVGAAYSKLTYTPVTGNSCIDPDTTWNARSGESFTCSGMTTCNGRSSRWSKNRFNPCEPGVTIDSCVVSTECKGGSVCDVPAQKCVRPK